MSRVKRIIRIFNTAVHAPTPTKAGSEYFFPLYPNAGWVGGRQPANYKVDSPREWHPDGIPKSLKCFTKGYSRGDDFCVRALLIPKSCPYDSCRYLSKPVGSNASQRPGTVGIVSPRCSVSPSHIPVSNNFLPVPEHENICMSPHQDKRAKRVSQ